MNPTNTSAPFTGTSKLEKTDADKTLDRMIERSKRKVGVRLPSTFATNQTLSRFVQGGRGGEVRLKLYLSMVLLAGNDHEHPEHGKHKITDVSSGAWAEALDLGRQKSRRVSDAQNWMHKNRLIQLERKASHSPHVTILNPSGDGKPWTSPTSPYINIPVEIWVDRWIWKLCCKELAVLIAIIDLCSGKDDFAFLSGSKKNRYGLSTDTWRLAATQLEAEHQLIETCSKAMAHDLGVRRTRKGYKLTMPTSP